jgi:hypothetical protein
MKSETISRMEHQIFHSKRQMFTEWLCRNAVSTTQLVLVMTGMLVDYYEVLNYGLSERFLTYLRMMHQLQRSYVIQ